jgi:putative transposase
METGRTVIDQFSRQTPLLEPRFSFGGRDVVAALDRAIEQAGTPISITVDHGTEFTSKALEEWAYRRGVKLDSTHPGKPTENGARSCQFASGFRVRPLEGVTSPSDR